MKKGKKGKKGTKNVVTYIRSVSGNSSVFSARLLCIKLCFGTLQKRPTNEVCLNSRSGTRASRIKLELLHYRHARPAQSLNERCQVSIVER